MTKEEVLRQDESYRCQLLDRLLIDCKYYLGWGGRSSERLWARSIDKQIEYIKLIYDSFPSTGKPDWIALEQIDELERLMKNPEVEKFLCRHCVQIFSSEVKYDSLGKMASCPKCGARVMKRVQTTDTPNTL